MYITCYTLYKVDLVDRSAVIKFCDYAMVVAGSTVRRGGIFYLLLQLVRP